jgi:hypothetical protein
MSNMVGSHTLKWPAAATATAWISCFFHTALSSLVAYQLFGSHWRYLVVEQSVFSSHWLHMHIL